MINAKHSFEKLTKYSTPFRRSSLKRGLRALVHRSLVIVNTTRLVTAPMIAMVLSSNANADFYTCKDKSGHLITSDRPIAECADNAIQVYKDNGVYKGQTITGLTAEQRQAKELEDQQKSKEALQQEQLKKEQRYLLAHYPTENDIEVARQRALAIVDEKIATEKHAIDLSNSAIIRNQYEQAHMAANQPGKLRDAKNDEADLRESISQSEHLIQHFESEKSEINRQFDQTHRRYLEIVPATK